MQLEAASRGGEMTPLAPSGEVAWIFCLREAEEKRSSGACALQDPAAPPPRGHFPFPREQGSEKGSYQSVAGVARKPDLLQMSG